MQQLSKYCFLPFCFTVKKSQRENIISMILFFLVLVLYLELILFTVRYIKNGDFVKTVTVGSLVVCFFFCWLSALVFTIKRKDYTKIICWCAQRRSSKKSAEFIRKAFKFYVCAQLTAIFLVHAVSFIYQLVKRSYEPIFLIHLPFLEPTNAWIFTFNTLYQLITGLQALVPFTCFFSTYLLVFKYIYDQVALLVANCQSLTLKELITSHADVINVYKLFSEVNSMPLLAIQFLCYPLAYLAVFGLTVAPEVKTMGSFCGLSIAEMFILFHINERLVSQFESFQFEIYNLAWYNMTPKERKVLVIILTQPIPTLKGGGVYPMTHETFWNIMSNVYNTTMLLKEVAA